MRITGLKIVVFLFAVVGAAVAVYFKFFAVSDEDMIRMTLEEMRVCLLRDGSDSSMLETVGKIGDLKKHLMPEVTVDAKSWDLDGTVSKTFLTQRTFVALKTTARFDVNLGVVIVTLPEEKGGKAKASFTAHANYTTHGGKGQGVYPLDLYLVKKKGKWRVCGLVKRKNESKRTDETEKK